MYNLDFDACDRLFRDYARQAPADPLAPASQAACVLFRELDRAGVLDAELYTDDEKLFADFSDRKRAPDPQVRRAFFGFIDRAHDLAAAALKAEPANQQALFARALAYGLTADYLAMLEGKFVASAKPGKAGLEAANTLVRLNPTFYDAYLWPGVTNYLVGSLPFPLRWLARLRGYPGNKRLGITLIESTAGRGSLLKPYAKILLVVINLRGRNRAAALELLLELAAEFPGNALFAKHAARLSATMRPAGQ